MKQVKGIWLPASDTHFEHMMRKEPERMYGLARVGCYQHFKIDRALSLTEGRCLALDIGAHVGFWLMWLAQEFAAVHAFEPVPEHAACFRRNVTAPNVTLHECAVGSGPGVTGVNPHADNSGKAALVKGDAVQVRSIDSFHFEHVDLIKIDVEGYEPHVLKGASETIARCRPLIVFEDNGQHERYGFESPQVVARRLGMTQVCQMGRDWIYQCS